MSITIHKKLAKPISYGKKRSLDSIRYIVIHYTGNKGDTAKGNASYFASSNERQAGAHFFVDKAGTIYKSVNMNRIAWSVGGKFSTTGGAGSYYGNCTNTNSISIELCDCIDDTNWSQMLATRQLVQYIQGKCANAKVILRHWDVNGKSCPAPMTGKKNEKWKHLHTFLTAGYQFNAKVIKNAALRSAGKVTATNKIGSRKKGDIVKISKIVGNWGRLKSKDSNGRYCWITLSKIQELA